MDVSVWGHLASSPMLGLSGEEGELEEGCVSEEEVEGCGMAP